MLKICHIISGDLWAGAEVMDFNLLKGLKEYQSLEIHAILFNDGRMAEEIRKIGVPVHIVDESKLNIYQLLLNMRKIIKKINPDIIHSHRYKENLSAYLASRNGNKIKLLYTQHGLPEFYGNNISLRRILLTKLNFTILSRCFHSIVTVSEEIRNHFIIQYGISDKKIVAIHNGVDIPRNMRIFKQDQYFVIGSSGRFFPVKDYALMVEVAREIRNYTDKIRFELAGDGPEKARILELVRKYGLENSFSFRGFLKDMPDFFQGLDLYINTSLHEGIPMSVLEAMAHGLPVVAPAVGGLKEILKDGVHGFLVEERGPKAFAEKCIYLYQNEKLRRAMAKEARDRVANDFSRDRMVQEYHRLYKEIHSQLP